MKLQNFIFYLLIFFLPSQLGKHFWPDFSSINGLRVDYLSPTLYLTDILVFLLFIFYLLSSRALKISQFYKVKSFQNFSDIFSVNESRDLLQIKSVEKDSSTRLLGSVGMTTGLIFLFSISLFAQNPTLSFLKLLKISELIFLGWFVSKKGIKLSTIIFLLLVTVFYESILAIWQFIKQGSVGGFWWLWGERTFNSSTPFISQAIINGQLILRAYGTFPHPNVLGGYLAIVLPLIIWNLKMQKSKVIFYCTTIILGIVTLFLTFSRTAWLVFALGLICLLFLNIRHSGKSRRTSGRIQNQTKNGFWTSQNDGRKLNGLIVLVLLLAIGIYLTVGSSVISRFQTLEDVDKKSLLIREQLNTAALKMVEQHPVFGVGLNNFLIELPRYYNSTGAVRFFQPAHNIYLEIAAEAGVAGLIIFIIFIIFTIRRLVINHSYLMLLLVFEILVLGLFDHYFYTLQQAQLVFALILGLAWVKKFKI